MRRSTKARPATPSAASKRSCHRSRAQRRPGRQLLYAGSFASPPVGNAQRRPARPSRQLTIRGSHSFNVSAIAQRRPARPGRQLFILPFPVPSGAGSAQQRPARPGRQLEIPVRFDRLGFARSTKAGPAGPATLGYSSPCSAHSQGAQRRPARPGRQLRAPNSNSSSSATPLNEGRPGRAGNSVAYVGWHGEVALRSTKAGPAGPATPWWYAVDADGRWLAQRRPARPGRQLESWLVGVFAREHHRSTKAGPAGPATPSTWCRLRSKGSTLNEGRPGRAGNSAWAGEVEQQLAHAQRRPARPGRQLPQRGGGLRPPRPRSTKAGPAGPATLLRGVSGLCGRARSTKAGPAGPATLY